MHTSTCTGLIEWLQVFSAYFFLTIWLESLAGHRQEFSLKLYVKSWPKFGASHNAVVAGALAGVHVGPCMGITSCVPRQFRLLWPHVRLSIKWRGMAWVLSCRMGEGGMFCSARIKKDTHSCLNKNLSWYFQKLSRPLANCLIEFPQERRPLCFQQCGRQRHAYAGM